MPNIPSTSWDETAPSGSQAISLGDDRIRELKTQIREVIDVDHDFPSSGQATDNGQHKKVTLQNGTTVSAGLADTGIIHSEDVSGKAELFYMDEDNNDVQITSGGKIKAESLGGVYPATNVAAIASIMTLIYPVGSYYFNDSVSTNPGTLLGVGTWVAVEERVLVGYKSGSAEFGTAGGEYGEKTHLLTAAESGLPAHNHTLNTYNDGTSGAVAKSASANNPTGGATGTNSAVDASQAHNNCQPSRTVYMWRRTA